jgi:hypothetical protein
MRLERESGIEFDFSAALSCSKHDTVNRAWPGVDFLVEEPTRWIWLEVKNWEPSALPPRYRGGQRRSFLSKMKSKTFFTEVLRGKFLGTSAFLALTNQHPAKDIVYVVLLQSPRFDSALKLHAIDRMSKLIPRRGPWFVNVGVAVVDLRDWNRLFSPYPATVIP